MQKFHLKLGRSQIQPLCLYGARNIYADDEVAGITDALGDLVTKSELANVLILNGQPVESGLAYQQIYATAKRTIFVVDYGYDLMLA